MEQLTPPSRSRRSSRRSRSGCNTCRARKVKCDERPGCCTNCERLQLSCSIDSSTYPQVQMTQRSVTSSPAAENISKRKRTYRSCTQCHISKARCSGERTSCQRCRSRDLQCIYEADQEPVWAKRLSSLVTTGKDVGLDQNTQENALDRYSSNSPQSKPDEFEALLWLKSEDLPNPHRIRVLVGHYFENIHPLRCFAFIHKPTFLRKLDDELDTGHHHSALLHIMCAFGAQFYALHHSETEGGIPSTSILNAGNSWAKKAQNLILAELGNICIENLMAAILLNDYQLRIGEYANAFMISSITARMAQALQINLEYSTDILCQEVGNGPSASVKESRRRLMWSCYVTDALVGCGIDQLTMIDDKDIKIQLPCHERYFLLQMPCITEILEEGQVLKFSPPAATRPIENMGMMAAFVRYIALRKKILRYLKHLDVTQAPWLPDSEFSHLNAASLNWYNSLPSSLQFTPTTLYIRKETSQLSALCLLHYAYHQTMCDFYRVGSPTLYKLRGAVEFPPEQYEFQLHLQNSLYHHAKSLSIVAAEAMRHGAKSLADSWFPTMTYDSNRMMLYHLTQVVDPTDKALMKETIPHLQSNIAALRIMRRLFAVADPLCAAAESMFQKACMGIESITGIIPADPYRPSPEDVDSIPGTPVQSAPDYILNPLSIYRMARKAIPEKHAPEKIISPGKPSELTPVADLSYSTSFVGGDLSESTRDPFRETQIALEEFQNAVNFDLGRTWHPAETAIESSFQGAGFPPWVPNALSAETQDHNQLDFYQSIFPIPHSHDPDTH